MIKINQLAPEFCEEVYHNDEIKRVSLADYKGKWVVLFFYPADFTFVCPTELSDLADKYKQFKELNCEVISVSTDRAFVHKAWHDVSDTIKKIQYPMLADPTHSVCKAYGTLIEDVGESLRATIIINPEGVIKVFEYHDNDIGRNGDEILRKIQAAQFSAKHGEVCPMNWKPGEKTLKPGLDLVGKI